MDWDNTSVNDVIMSVNEKLSITGLVMMPDSVLIRIKP